MRQGCVKRVEVAIARSRELDGALLAGLRSSGVNRMEDIDTSRLMGVDLIGANFEITSLSAPDGEQLVSPTAHWEFDIRAKRSGMQTLQLVVWMGILLPNRPGGRRAVPVLERKVHVRVDPIYGTRQFVAHNWQWLVGSVIAAGGGVTAWVELVH